MKAKLMVALGIAAVVLVVLAAKKAGLLEKIPVIGNYV